MRRFAIQAILSAVLLSACAAAAGATCAADPDSLNFSSSIVGEANHRTLVITNTQGAPVAGMITVEGYAHANFRFTVGGSAHPYSLAPGESEAVDVFVTPNYGGPLDVRLDLGPLAAGCEPTDVACHAYGMYPPGPGLPDCATVPTAFMQFPPTVVGGGAAETLWVINAGGEYPQQGAGFLEGVLPTVCGDFRIPWGGPFAITDHQTWDVLFLPTTPGWHQCTLDLPDLCWDMELRGLGLVEGTACSLSTTALELGPVPVGDTATGEFRILNLGTETLPVSIPAGCGPFAVVDGPRPRTLAPGEEERVLVRFTPVEPGLAGCELDLGQAACGAVAVSGSGLEPGGTGDLIGIWFEESGVMNRLQTTVPYETVTAYLMILEPSVAYGVLGWECCVEVQGDVLGLSWDLAGSAVNVAAPPCFAVGLGGGPLLGAHAILLATLTFVQPDPDLPTTFYIHPLDSPSLPGVPSYVDGQDIGHLVPLAWSSGAETVPVAVVNEDVTDAGTVPEPVTRLGPARPNPFNPSTTLSFTTAADGAVRLAIHDVQGRRIRVLADGLLPAGSHVRRWDGRDESGRPQASGIYFACLEAGGKRQLRKLTLLK